MGSGYSFEVVKARLLLDPEARKATTKTIRSRPRKPAPEPSAGMDRMLAITFDFDIELPDKVIEYGPHIPTLCRLLEEGHFE